MCYIWFIYHPYRYGWWTRDIKGNKRNHLTFRCDFASHKVTISIMESWLHDSYMVKSLLREQRKTVINILPNKKYNIPYNGIKLAHFVSFLMYMLYISALLEVIMLHYLLYITFKKLL
jgi:hypothetical protein